LSSDAAEVVSDAALVAEGDESNCAPGKLMLGSKYYRKVTEVNEAEAVSSWDGDLWSFTTQEYIVIDDFESYDDEDNRIYDAWIDGWVNETGSTVGYIDAPFAERIIVHGGGQSMPLEYNNTVAPFYSEAAHSWGAPRTGRPAGRFHTVVLLWRRGQ